MVSSNINPCLVLIDEAGINIYLNLYQAYEAEYSAVSGKLPDCLGVFKLDTLPHHPNVGYFLYVENLPVGFCVVNIESDIKDVAEFYIIPALRRKNLGYWFAERIFTKHPGKWQVRQALGSDRALSFWRKVIARYTDNLYSEAEVLDPFYGQITRQRFKTP